MLAFHRFFFRKKRNVISGESSAAFIDLDGVLWDNKFSSHIFHFRLSRQAKSWLSELSNSYDYLVVITNQTYGARHIKFPSAYHVILWFKFQLLLLVTRDIDAIFVCTHHPKATHVGFRRECICRKPRPGLITSSMSHFGIAPSKSIFIGDRITDIYAADSAGIMSNFLLENRQMFEVNQSLDFPYHIHSPFFRFLPSLDSTESVDSKIQFTSENKLVLYLSAGLGTRLKPITDSTPKPLLEIQGETILKRLIHGIEKNLTNVSHVVNISHLPSSFSRLQKSLGSEIDLTFSYEKTPIGSSKTLLNLAKSTDFRCNILVFHADLALSDKYFHELSSWFEQNLGSWVIGHFRPGHSARSTIEMDANNIVNSFSNAIGHGDSLQIVNSGIYSFSSEDLEIIAKYDLHGEISDEILPILVKEQKLKCKVINESRLSIDHLDTLQLAQDFTF